MALLLQEQQLGPLQQRVFQRVGERVVVDFKGLGVAHQKELVVSGDAVDGPGWLDASDWLPLLVKDGRLVRVGGHDELPSEGGEVGRRPVQLAEDSHDHEGQVPGAERGLDDRAVVEQQVQVRPVDLHVEQAWVIHQDAQLVTRGGVEEGQLAAGLALGEDRHELAEHPFDGQPARHEVVGERMGGVECARLVEQEGGLRLAEHHRSEGLGQQGDVVAGDVLVHAELDHHCRGVASPGLCGLLLADSHLEAQVGGAVQHCEGQPSAGEEVLADHRFEHCCRLVEGAGQPRHPCGLRDCRRGGAALRLDPGGVREE